MLLAVAGEPALDTVAVRRRSFEIAGAPGAWPEWSRNRASAAQRDAEEESAMPGKDKSTKDDDGTGSMPNPGTGAPPPPAPAQVQHIPTPLLVPKSSKELADEQGFPETHTRVFLAVAKDRKHVILSRTPGKACEGPLREGYSAKSFHIKAKSCDWGAAAGFLCLDPFLNKSGKKGAAFNLEHNHESLTVGYDASLKADAKGQVATVTPLLVSEERAQWLHDKAPNPVDVSKGPETVKYWAATWQQGEDLSVPFLLVKDQAAGSSLWKVYYDFRALYGIAAGADFPAAPPPSLVATFLALALADAQKNAPKTALTEKEKQKVTDALGYVWKRLREEAVDPKNRPQGVAAKYEHYVPVLAMVNPHKEHDKAPFLHLNAVTGDYDLFALWPSAGNTALAGGAQANEQLDQRVVPMKPGISPEDVKKGESKSPVGAVLGNISERVQWIAQIINQEIANIPLAKKGSDASAGSETPGLPLRALVNRIYHSDEAGRPGIDAVDDAAVFTPDGKIYMICKDSGGTAAARLSALIEEWGGKGYTIFANPGWAEHLTKAAQERITWPKG
jgi:hypothetical protein